MSDRSRDPIEWVRLQVGWLLPAVVRSDGEVHEGERRLLREFSGPRFGDEFEL